VLGSPIVHVHLGSIQTVILTMFGDTLCPIARSQAFVIVRWTIVVMREPFMGNRRFDNLMVQSQATPTDSRREPI